MKISIIGYGVVGKAVEKMLAEFYQTVIGEYRADVIFVCVPTPSKKNGGCDTSIVEDVVSKVEADLIVIKSTVVPGTTDYLSKKYDKNVVFSPEYIGESKYYNPYFNSDMKEVPFLICGGNPGLCTKFFDLMMPVLGPTKKYFKTDAINAEFSKYMENAFFMVKLAFVNIMRRVSEENGADWQSVREGWLLDPRINPMHTMALGKVGGKCLPKDLRALQKLAGEDFFEEVLKWAKKEF